MKRIVILLTAIFIFSAWSSKEAVAAEKNTETRKIEGFTKIKCSSGVDVLLIQGDKEMAIVEADKDVMERVITEVNGKTLRVTINKKSFFSSWRNKKVFVKVFYKNLESISVSSGADVDTDNTLKGKSLRVSVSSGADVDLSVDVVDISVSSSSGSDADVKGKAINISCSASSGSDIDARKLIAKNGTASVSSGADIELTATERFSGSASSGGDVDVFGNPSEFKKNTSSGGDISKK